eukprot:gene1220-968_t
MSANGVGDKKSRISYVKWPDLQQKEEARSALLEMQRQQPPDLDAQLNAWEKAWLNIRWRLAGPRRVRHRKDKAKIKKKWMSEATIAALRRRDALHGKIKEATGEGAKAQAEQRYKVARRVAQAMLRAEHR